MKFKVVGTPAGFRVLAPWGAFVGPTFTDKLEAYRWVDEHYEKGAWRR